jgi:hypothetical protein
VGFASIAIVPQAMLKTGQVTEGDLMLLDLAAKAEAVRDRARAQ